MSLSETAVAQPSASDRIQQHRRYLMCKPAHFTVSYEINPWMHKAIPTDTAKAVRQWQTLYDTYLSLEPAHGYGIAQRLEQISKSVVQVNQGSLYPALHRLEQKRWLAAEWKQSETGREAKFYSLTAAGRKQLAAEKDSWARLAGAVRLIFEEGGRP